MKRPLQPYMRGCTPVAAVLLFIKTRIPVRKIVLAIRAIDNFHLIGDAVCYSADGTAHKDSSHDELCVEWYLCIL